MKSTNISTSYPNIDMQATGARLKRLASIQGYSVSAIQEYLHLSCPQPVYRWFQGKVLPTVDHLYMLSMLFEVHMEELLVPTRRPLQYGIDMRAIKRSHGRNRLLAYHKSLYGLAA